MRRMPWLARLATLSRIATEYAYAMSLIRRAHEWAADHSRFVQYPRPVRVRRIVERPDWMTVALKWMALVIGLWWIWGGFLLIVVCALIAVAV